MAPAVLEPRTLFTHFEMGFALRSRDLEFWTKVRAGRDANDEAIKIACRRKLVEVIEALAGSDFSQPPAFDLATWRPETPAEQEEGREIYRRWALWRADRPYSSRAEYACGIYQLELQDAKRMACARRSTGVLVRANFISDWEDGFGIKRYTMLQISAEDRALLGHILAQSRKRGRPPVGDVPMTEAERQRRRREKLKLFAGVEPEENHADPRAGDRVERERGAGTVDRGRARPGMAKT
jgi:hypothetical protein